MSNIKVKMFGTPIITKDDKEILFPYSKVKALFYYLIVNQRASRDELSGLLWCDDREDIAKKNLRNAIYKIKKSFDEEILISPNKSIVMINPKSNITSDIHFFENNIQNPLELYDDDFLKGFFVKNAEPFEEWLIETREYYRENLVKKLYDNIYSDLKCENNERIEAYCKKLISINEFDEKAYSLLIEHYTRVASYKDAINTYNKLSTLLSKELGITPDVKTTQLFNKVLDIINDSNYNKIKSSQDIFYGRVKELRLLEQNYEKLIHGQDSKSVIITGEAGIGKSRLKDEFLKKINQDDAYIFSTNCYPAEKKYLFKPWNVIISKISDILKQENILVPVIWENMISIFPEFKENKTINYNDFIDKEDTFRYDMIGDTLTELLYKLTSKKKVVFIFEDIQYADPMTISILSSVIFHQKKSDIIFIATYRNEYDKNVEELNTSMNMYNKLITIHLDRLSKSETEKFIKQYYPQYKLNSDILKKIYEETEGNTFFLTEYINILKTNGNINIMTSKMQDIIKSKFLYLSEQATKILNISSLFFDEIPLNLLIELTGYNELELIDIIEELEKKFILKEVHNDKNISFKFTHQKLREFVYINQSEARKKLLHAKIASILETYLKNSVDINLYHKIIYHYNNADKPQKSLNYKIKILNYYLNFSHELFPIFNQIEHDDYRYEYFNKNQTLVYFKDVENTLKQIKKNIGTTTEISKLEISYLHMKGRYLIRDGDYEQGTKLIQDMLTQALEIQDRDYALEGYKQMIFYCIQTSDINLMIKYIELALDLAVECNYHKEIGILLRLKGLYKIMCKEYEDAEKLLIESINIFNITTQVANKYSLNIAAAYNYIGDIRRFNMKFSEALYYYEKAITICESKNALLSIAVFNINAGQAAFDMGDYIRSKEYFEKATTLYNKVDSIWRKSIAEAFMCLIFIKDGSYTQGLKYLKHADSHSQKMMNPHEIGIVFRVKSEIRILMSENENLNKIYSKYLDKDFDYYFDEGVKNLKNAGDNYELEVMNILKNRVSL